MQDNFHTNLTASDCTQINDVIQKMTMTAEK